MAIIIEHEKRRNEILEKALDVFVEEGFENATFQKIAAKCDITRTTLYLYFKNKKEIFNFCIKQLLLKVEHELKRIGTDTKMHSVEKITKVLINILQVLQENRLLLLVILDYLLVLSRSSGDADTRIRRRTVRLRHILSTMVIAGVKKGDLAPINIKAADDLLYSFIEAAIFRLVVLRHESVDELKDAAALAVQQLKKQGAK